VAKGIREPGKKYKLWLENYRPVKYGAGKKARNYYNKNTGEVISVREFQKRAEWREVKPKPHREPQSIHEKRVRWYTNHYNREIFMTEGHGTPDEYISFSEAEADPDFIAHEAMIRSRDEAVRDEGYAYFDELYDEYQNEDWGETP
jgi:hypothetical protein